MNEWNTGLNKLSNFSYEFVLVEDGSTDGTKDLIKELENRDGSYWLEPEMYEDYEPFFDYAK